MMVTVLLAILSFNKDFMCESYIALITLSFEFWIVSFLDEKDRYEIVLNDNNTVFLINRQAIKPYNGVFDYNTSKSLLQKDIEDIKYHRDILKTGGKNSLQSLAYRLSDGRYLLTEEDVKQAKMDLLTIYSGDPDDKFLSYKYELFELIKTLYLLDSIKTH